MEDGNDARTRERHMLDLGTKFESDDRLLLGVVPYYDLQDQGQLLF